MRHFTDASWILQPLVRRNGPEPQIISVIPVTLALVVSTLSQGHYLRDAGYSHHGAEPVSLACRTPYCLHQVYSGVSGGPLYLDVFTGIVYYQRLRHMIADKSQVRATGPVHKLTMQPVKGRKRHGGIRLGEMERDALLSHGTSFLLCDRLLDCSDRTLLYHCSNPECTYFGSSAVGPNALPLTDSRLFPVNDYGHFCHWCRDMSVTGVAVPYICRFV